MLVAGSRCQGFEVQLGVGRDAGHEHAGFVPTRHKRFENALGRHAQIVGHGNSGKILFVHRRAVQRVGNSQFFQQAGGVSFGNFGMR